MKLTAFGITDVGLLRSNNEDSFLCAAESGLFIVADGMGGHLAGEIASEMAVHSSRDQLIPHLQNAPAPEVLTQLLRQSLQQTNHDIIAAAKQNPAWRGMGTTLTLLLLRDGQGQLLHIGDSRLYRLRNQQLEQLSEDHSLVAEQLRRGLISSADIDSSNLRNVLLQAVGASPELEPDQKLIPIQPGDLFLLCSDGLTNMLPNSRIETILTDSEQLQDCADSLVQQANAAGGQDNITAVLIRVDEI